MKLFLWENLESDNYHSEGGLVIVAENIDRAKEMVKDDKHIKVPDDARYRCFDLASPAKEEIFIFPDSGCC